MSQERYEDLNLPPEGDFELYRYKNAEKMRTSGWSGPLGEEERAGDYEIRAVTAEGKGTIPWGCVLGRSLREILREGRLISAATSSSRSGGIVFHTGS